MKKKFYSRVPNSIVSVFIIMIAVVQLAGCTKTAPYISGSTINPPDTTTTAFTGTLLGCFVPANLSVASVQSINTGAVRVVLPGGEPLDSMLNLAASGAWPSALQNISNLSKAGIKVVVTVSWNSGHFRTPLPQPGSTLYNIDMDTWSRFIKLMGPYLYAVVLDNEPQHDYAIADLETQSDGSITAINWFKTLTANAAALRAQNSNLSHLLISSPALMDVNSLSGNFEQALFKWVNSDANVNLMDFHAHLAATTDIENLFSYVMAHTTKKVIVTEWSQSAAGAEWLKQPVNSAFASAHSISSSLTADNFIKQCYSHPVDAATWNDFIATAPFSPSYISGAFSIMQGLGVQAVFYGSYGQGGSSPVYDADKLFANVTVAPGANGQAQPNYLFLKWYKAELVNIQN